MRLLSILFASLFTFTVLNFAQGQDLKLPAPGDVKKDPAAKDQPDPKKVDDKKPDDKKPDDKKPDDKKPDDKKPDDKKPDDKKKDPKDTTPKFTFASTFVGKLTTITQTGEMTVQVTNKVKTYHADAQQRLFNWQQDLANRQKDLYNRQVQIAQEKNPQNKYNQLIEYQKQMFEYQKVQAKPPELFYFKDVTSDVIVKQAKDMKVRIVVPELQYDAKGNPVALTKEKAKEMAGPEGYPGFPAEVGTLQTNMQVQVYLAPPPAPKDPKKKGPDITDIIGGGTKDKDSPMVDDDPTVPRVLVILVDNTNWKK